MSIQLIERNDADKKQKEGSAFMIGQPLKMVIFAKTFQTCKEPYSI